MSSAAFLVYGAAILMQNCWAGPVLDVSGSLDRRSIKVLIKNESDNMIILHKDNLPFTPFDDNTEYSFTYASQDKILTRDIYIPGYSNPRNTLSIGPSGTYEYEVTIKDLFSVVSSLPAGLLTWQWELPPYCAQDGKVVFSD